MYNEVEQDSRPCRPGTHNVLTKPAHFGIYSRASNFTAIHIPQRILGTRAFAACRDSSSADGRGSAVLARQRTEALQKNVGHSRAEGA
jgi:hypothetical protein